MNVGLYGLGVKLAGWCGARIASTGDGRLIMPEYNYHLAFAKVMICGDRYTEKHARCRTSTQMMIFTADTQKGGKMDDLISRLSELRCQYNCFDENERDAYHTLSEAIKALSDVPDTNVGDTISRQAAIRSVCEKECRVLKPCNAECGSIIALRELPSVEAEPVRQGRWILITKDGIVPAEFLCSVCGRKILHSGVKDMVSIHYPYCHCGAKMDEAT